MRSSGSFGRRSLGAASIILCLGVLSYNLVLVSSFQPASTTTSWRRTLSSPKSPLSIHDNNHQYFYGRQRQQSPAQGKSSTSLNSFMGSDGGLFGIGTPEIITILLVGYFVLGPSDLYKLVKEIGKFIQNIRTLGTEASKTFESSMESQLELQEIRKAQRELNNAFSFRRSINVDDDSDAFETGPQQPAAEEMVPPVAAAAAATTATATGEDATAPLKRKKKRRRVKKRQLEPEPAVATTMESATTSSSSGNVPDLDMDDAFPSMKKKDWFDEDDEDNEYDTDVTLPSASEMAKEDLAWLQSPDDATTSKTTTKTTATAAPKDPPLATQEQSRFQQQLSGSWNQKVLENEDQLAPLALIMERLAILEEEKAAADRRLEEEFQKRMQLEEDFYRRKRELLESSAAQVQKDAYVTMDNGSVSSSSSKK